MTKRNRDNRIKNHKTESNEVERFLIIVTTIVAVFLIFYIITAFVNKKVVDSVTDGTIIQYDEIIVGDMLNQSLNEYYVLATMESDANDLYAAYISYYEGKAGFLKTYTVDLDNVFNKSFVADISNFNFTDIANIRFKGETLLRIKNKKIVAIYEGQDPIIAQYKSLIK